MATLHLISHTHWDREWYQTFQQFRLRLVRLVDNLLDILAQNPDYRHFMLDGQTIVLEDYLQMRPEREGELRHYIQNGRILVGPWYILPDEFLVSPEATIRNLLEGERLARAFGPKMSVGYLPDTFGHIGQIPQMLLGFGIDSASVWRGVEDQPSEFWWQSPDGSQVFTAYLREGYGNAAGMIQAPYEGTVRIAQTLAEQLRPHTAAPHLLLMNGTDHQEPSALTPAAVAFAQGQLGDDQLIHSTLPAYVEAARAALKDQAAGLPVVRGELRSSKRSPLLPGVLSTRMWIKQRNRACETLLERWAEPFSALSEQAVPGSRPAVALRQPGAILRQAWKLLMQCHPHDSICGCSIDGVHEEMRSRFDQVESIAEEITRQSLEALTTAIQTQRSGAQGSIIVFNPSQAPRSDLVQVTVEGLPGDASFEIVTAEGQRVPYEILDSRSEVLADFQLPTAEFVSAFHMVQSGSIGGMKLQTMEITRQGSTVTLSWTATEKGEPNMEVWDQGYRQVQEMINDPSIEMYHVVLATVPTTTLRLVAPDVPGLGYRTLWVCRTGSAAPAPQVAPAPDAIENESYRVEARPDGTLDVLDKASGQWYRGQNRLQDGGDRGDEYNYSPPAQDEIVAARLIQVQVEASPVRHSMTLQLEIDVPESLAQDRQSRSARRVAMAVSTRVTLLPGVRRIDLHTEVDNPARDHRLRAHFSAPFAVSEVDCDGHFEVVRRPIALPAWDDAWVEQPRPEKPQRTFTAVSDGRHGLLVANHGLPEVEGIAAGPGVTEIAVTLLRCVGWLSRQDFPERRGHAGPALETPAAQMPGRWSFDLALLPFEEAERYAVYQRAYAFETPLRATAAGLQDGPLPDQASLVQVEPAAFAISALKATQDGRGWLLRGVNLADHPLDVRVQTRLPYRTVELANLAEQAQQALTPAGDGSLIQPVAGHQILTLLYQG